MSTIHANTSFTLDGVNNFSVGADSFTWNSGWLESIDVWSDDPASAYTATVTLTGSNWAVGALRFGNDAAVTLSVTINDSATGSNRWIDFLRLAATNNTVTLTHTGVGSIQGGGPANHNITTGDQWVGSILLFEGNDTVTIGSGGSESIIVGKGTNTVTTTTEWAGSITGYEGNDTVHIGSGGASAVNLGNGTNIVTTAGSVDAIFAYDGNDTAAIGPGGFVGSVNLGGGNNTVTVKPGADYVQSIVGYNGIDIVNVVGAGGGVGSIDVGHGNNRVTTGASFVNSILGLNGNDTVTLGTGDLGTVNVGGGNNVVTTGSGGISAIVAYAGSDRVTIGSGGVGSIDVGGGNDIVTLLVNVGGANSVNGGTGNDIYNLSSHRPAVIDHGGIDTITTTLSWDLGDGRFPTIEKLTLLGVGAINGHGNGLNNVITGNNAANKLNGGAGNDTIRGNGGNDTLLGNLGLDNLGGGLGNDKFLFHTPPSVANRDTIVDFANAAGNNDIFHLENAVFTKLGLGGPHALNAGFFRAGAAALDANDFIVYNKVSGALFYDFNANAAGGAVQIATLSNHATLTAADFFVI